MLAALLWLACAVPPPPPPAVAAPVPTLELTAPWRLDREDGPTLWLRLGDTGDGVRVDLAPTAGRVPGVALIEGGRVREVRDGERTWPLVAVSEPDQALSNAEIRVRGVDLEVHLAGRPIRARSRHPDAPVDPQITWVRVRRSVDAWRIVVQGLGTVSLPGEGFEVALADEGDLAFASAWGNVTFGTDAVATTSTFTPTRWALDLRPALDALQPYPKTRLDLTPSRPRP